MSCIPEGSLVLVTGVNGLIASHVADQLLQLGYKVRGTVRNSEKGDWLKEHFDAKYGSGSVDIAVVADMSKEGAFNESVKGCAGVVHVASNLSFDKDPHKVIPEVIAGITHTLEAADTEPLVKRFVYTSSSTAATSPIPNKEFTIDSNTWNQSAIDQAWAPPPYEGEARSWAVYGASKTQAEQELWKFMKERKPHFEANAVLPNANFGLILDRKQQGGSTAGWIDKMYTSGGVPEYLQGIPPQWLVDVQDTARLHVIALIDPDVKSERLFAFAEPYNWNTLLQALRKIRPQKEWAQDLPDQPRDLSKIAPKDMDRARKLLQKHYNKDFTAVEAMLEANIQGL